MQGKRVNMKRTITWNGYTGKQLSEMEKVSQNYRKFLDNGKTERECITVSIKMAEEAGYRSLDDYKKGKEKLKAGDKVYVTAMGKTLALFHIGEKSLEDGMHILGAHVDSPRLDIKQNPLYEEEGLAYLDTHYYGGIKKYQWVTLPLAIHGVVVKTDGTSVNITIGEKEEDPVFCVTDLLIHLASEQMEKKANKVIEGEALDILFGSKPIKGEEKDAVRKGILKILKDSYGIEEEDFQSAELEVVPAGKARQAGLDASMIMAYGQDDRVCAYASLAAMLDLNIENLKKTACCLLVDKEEIGSVGATGMRSRFFENAVAEIMDQTGDYSELLLRRCLSNSQMLSSDVSAAFDPNYASAFEKRNSAYLGKGIVFNKYVGSKGKSGSNDCNAEYFGKIRNIMEKNKVTYQTAEIGKVDVGGGGTIAYILSLYGMEVVDCGVAVLSMHAPWEVTSKADVYEAKRGYSAFLKEV